MLWHHAAYVDDLREQVGATRTYSQMKTGENVGWSDVSKDFDAELSEVTAAFGLELELVNDSKEHVGVLSRSCPAHVTVRHHPRASYGGAVLEKAEWQDAVRALFPLCRSDETLVAKVALISAATEYLPTGADIGAIMDFIGREDPNRGDHPRRSKWRAGERFADT